MNESNFLLYGQAEPPPPPVPLRAGPLHLLYEPASGFVRRITLGRREVLRGIYAAVRDCNWDTIPGILRETRHVKGVDAFRIEFESEHRLREIHFVWRGSICGEPDGVLRYAMEGEAWTTFRRNRIGLCVLHPIRECAGAAARQTRADGRSFECRFPETIERQIFGQNSFQNLHSLAHEVAPGLWAEVEFEGDLFETEDQRNWTDASFKTYGTPLALPFPVEVPAGTRIRQAVTLRLQGTSAAAGLIPVELVGEASGQVTISDPAEGESPLPRLGLGVASHGEALTEKEIARLRLLPLSHLRVDLKLSSPAWADQWQRAVRQADQLGLGLELALYLPRSGEPNVVSVRGCLQSTSVPLARVLALREGEAATSPGTLAWVREAVRGLSAPVGAGSDANFCELNREQSLGRFAGAEADFLFWPINPQVHAFDHRSLVETLEAQPATVTTARALARGQPLVITPVTLKPRFNPVATGAPLPVPPGVLPPQVDPRQRSLFGAAWTLGSLAALGSAGAASVTWYETTGWRGVMETEAGSTLPEKFPSCPGELFPVFHAFAGIAGFDHLWPLLCDLPSAVATLGLTNRKGQRRLLLANLTHEPMNLRLRMHAESAVARILDLINASEAAGRPDFFLAQSPRTLQPDTDGIPLALGAHALACVDLAAAPPNVLQGGLGQPS
jgi:hypothetical protein